MVIKRLCVFFILCSQQIRAGLHDVDSLSKKPPICAIQECDAHSKTIRPYILVEIGAKFKIELALFNIGADLNALSYESWITIDKPTITPSTTTIDSFVRDSNPIEGYLDLQILIGNTNVCHRFYVMKLGKLTSPIILGQPGQQTYNGVPNCEREGINFEINGT